ncbi:MAG: glycosyltransferase family 39 protein [Synergistaceae bacterium]|nr:glycosyltransferase family 39 protein [Synergistaceae bacterium]
MEKNLMSDNKLRTLIFAAVTVVIILSGWLCDDAYHGFVMAKHLVEGNGFVYNIGERVNASTCPLFTLIIAGIYALFGRGMYIIGIGTCVIFSVLCVYMLLYKTCRTRGDLIFITLILCSKSFISYSTSGLENSLLFALGMLFFLVMFKSESYSGGELFILSFLAGLIALTRMDNILIYLPFLIYCFIVRKNKIGRLPAFFIGFAGVLPFIAWEIFSLFYYGFLFPNTAYIKLGTMISLRLYIRKGIEYVIASFAMDPAVIIIPVAYIFIALLMCRDIRHKLLSLGTALYIIYVIRIGGDFMSGRHFTVIYILSSAAVVMILRENIIKFDIKRASKILVVCMMYAVTIGNLLDSVVK